MFAFNPSRTLGLAALCLAWGSAAGAIEMPAIPPNLTLAMALDQAMHHNPQVLAAQSQVTQAQDAAHDAALWPLRAINANAGYYTGFGGITPGATTPGALFGNGLTGGVGLGVNLGDLVGGFFKVHAAQAAADEASQNLRQVQAAVAEEVTADYAAYLAQKRLLAVSQEAIAAGRSDVVVAERLFGNGNATISDVYKARLAASKTNVDLIKSEGNYSKAWASLLGVMGDTDWLNTHSKTR